MPDKSNATEPSGATAGVGLGALAVLLFSFSLPATRLAVEDLDPVLVGLGRAVVAGVLAFALLLAVGAPRPTSVQWRRLVFVAIGVVVGFPLLTALALQHVSAAHGAVVVGLLPAATAAMAVLRAGERPSRAFWGACGLGIAAVLAFTVVQSSAGGNGFGAPATADVLLVVGVVLCALGYAEGGALAREIGGWQTICWALVMSAPLLAPISVLAALGTFGGSGGLDAGAEAWLGFAYVSIVSMFLGFFAWYAGLARGGVARIAQIQLAMPLLSLGWAAALLGEDVGATTIVAAVFVLLCVAATQRTRVAVSQVAVRPARSAVRQASRGG